MTADPVATDLMKKSLGRLDVQRKSLEMEAEAIISELTSEPEGGGRPMGVDTPLVDQDGYPRGDVDVYRARDLRHRLAVIKTDHKGLTTQVETSLTQLAFMKNPNKSEEEANELSSRAALKPKPKYDPATGKWIVKNWDGSVAGVAGGDERSFDVVDDASKSVEATHSIRENNNNNNSNSNAPPSASAASAAASTATTTPATAIVASGPPFAKIDAVAALSPAATAGIQEGDLIVEFGSVQLDNNDNLRALMPVVATAADAQGEISITLLRTAVVGSDVKTTMRVALVPKPWPGRGLIGCHIVPYTE